LLNRREFDRILEEEVERALRFSDPLALVMVDVDHFKSVNDQHGHPIGDAVLREVASRLSSLVRNVDRVVRFGGEEFGLILMQSERAAALDVAKRVCAIVRETPVAIGGALALNVTVSAGVAALPQDARSSAALVAAADKALYAAKSGGRNRAIAAGE
jgi:diguanylate cyclase (GGDEF)-like protein